MHRLFYAFPKKVTELSASLPAILNTARDRVPSLAHNPTLHGVTRACSECSASSETDSPVLVTSGFRATHATAVFASNAPLQLLSTGRKFVLRVVEGLKNCRVEQTVQVLQRPTVRRRRRPLRRRNVLRKRKSHRLWLKLRLSTPPSKTFQ